MTRRLGLEQEFFVVDPEGESSDRADELIALCRERAAGTEVDPEAFEGEWVKNILEIKTHPHNDLRSLAREYLGVIRVAIKTAEELDLRLYPLASYPLHLIPTIRDAVGNHVQVRTVGHTRFLHAGKCTGVHLHVELPEGTLDPTVGISYSSTPEAREEVLNGYNLGTALDPVAITLGRSCPFYEGQSNGLAYHTSAYRGSDVFGWEGVYTHLPAVGALRPYADDIAHLVQLQFERHYAWCDAMRKANVETDLFCDDRDSLLRTSWNPVRLNAHGTIEHRDLDSNLPSMVLGISAAIAELHRLVREERLTVTPTEGIERFTLDNGRLLVPDFEFLSTRLLFASVTEGIGSDLVTGYVRSALDLIRDFVSLPEWIEELMPHADRWVTIEEKLLDKYRPPTQTLTHDDGTKLVREMCDELTANVDYLWTELTGEQSDSVVGRSG